MNTPTPTPRSPESLTPEERALAARLVRLGPHGMPPPALDASILGAAHAAAGSHARSRPRRWPALLGLAATLALAIGVTWQMQPHMESAPRDEAPRAGALTAIADATSGDLAADTAATAPEAGRQTVQPAAQALPTPEPRRARAPAAAAAVTAPAEPAASVLSAPPPAPAAPTSAAPASTPAPQVAAEKSLDRAEATQAMRDSTARRMQDSAASQSVMAREGIAESARASAPAPDMADTPVESDRELAPAQWLERIRLRRDAGDRDGARASLQLLRRAYPELILPDDLRELAEDQGDPP